MGWDELVGFLIVLFIFVVPLLRKLLIDKRKVEKRAQQPPQEPPDEEYYFEEDQYRAPPPAPDIPIQFTPPVEAKPFRPTTKGLVKRDFAFHSEMEERALESEIAERKLETHIDPRFRKRIVSQAFIIVPEKKNRSENRIISLLSQRRPRQAMVIMSEIIGPPRGL